MTAMNIVVDVFFVNVIPVSTKEETILLAFNMIDLNEMSQNRVRVFCTHSLQKKERKKCQNFMNLEKWK